MSSLVSYKKACACVCTHICIHHNLHTCTYLNHSSHWVSLFLNETEDFCCDKWYNFLLPEVWLQIVSMVTSPKVTPRNQLTNMGSATDKINIGCHLTFKGGLQPFYNLSTHRNLKDMCESHPADHSYQSLYHIFLNVQFLEKNPVHWILFDIIIAIKCCGTDYFNESRQPVSLRTISFYISLFAFRLHGL